MVNYSTANPDRQLDTSLYHFVIKYCNFKASEKNKTALILNNQTKLSGQTSRSALFTILYGRPLLKIQDSYVQGV